MTGHSENDVTNNNKKELYIYIYIYLKQTLRYIYNKPAIILNSIANTHYEKLIQYKKKKYKNLPYKKLILLIH